MPTSAPCPQFVELLAAATRRPKVWPDARGEPWAPGDAEPEGDWLNDTTRPLIHAIAPRVAAELALQTAEQCDALVAELPPERLWPGDPDCPISALRYEHRAEHLDEIEAALKARG